MALLPLLDVLGFRLWRPVLLPLVGARPHPQCDRQRPYPLENWLSYLICFPFAWPFHALRAHIVQMMLVLSQGIRLDFVIAWSISS